jgi:hypothetical protein
MQSERTFSRREFGLRLGFGLAGLNLLNTFSSGLAAAPPMQQREKVRNTILIVLTGGMSQLDSFDYKPHAPSDIRGPFQPVQTKTREAVFSSLFPSLAAIDDQFLLFRAMKAKEAGAHEAAYGNWLRFNNRNDHLITTRLTRSNTDTIPYVNLMQEGTNLMEPEHVAHMNPGQALQIIWNEGSKTYEASMGAQEENNLLLEVGTDIAQKIMNDEKSKRHAALQRRMGLMKRLETLHYDDCDAIAAMQRHYELAERILLSGKPFATSLGLTDTGSPFGDDPCGTAFRIAAHCADPHAMNAQVVALECGHWDFHSFLEKNMKERAPAFDHALATLIERYGDRINICVRGEFGRTPQPQRNGDGPPGRNHFPLHACIMAGPSVKPGVYGTTSSTGEEIRDGELSEERFRDILLAATGHNLPQDEFARSFVKVTA